MSPEPAAQPQPISLAEDELRQILERAASLDAERVTGISVEDLHQIAMETGISADSLTIALREAESARLAPAPTPANRREPQTDESGTPVGRLLKRVPSWIRTGVIAWVSAATGFFAGVTIDELNTGALAIGALVALVWGSIELSVFHRKRGSLLTVQRDLLALWLPFATAGSLVFGRGGEEFFAISALVWLVVAIVGGLITTLNKPPEQQDAPRS